jgi:hypothetical protein
VAFSPDGKTLAAGYHEQGEFDDYWGMVWGVVLWDAAARKRLVEDPLAMKRAMAGGVAFSPDGKTLAAGYTADRVGGVVLWDIDRNSWERAARRIANRNMTLAEWHQFFPDEPNYRATFQEFPLPREIASQNRQ